MGKKSEREAALKKLDKEMFGKRRSKGGATSSDPDFNNMDFVDPDDSDYDDNGFFVAEQQHDPNKLTKGQITKIYSRMRKLELAVDLYRQKFDQVFEALVEIGGIIKPRGGRKENKDVFKLGDFGG